jgi:hypothetical protein
MSGDVRTCPGCGQTYNPEADSTLPYADMPYSWPGNCCLACWLGVSAPTGPDLIVTNET